MEKLIAHLEGNTEGELASALKRSWGTFAERPIAEFAVEMLNRAVMTHPMTERLVYPARSIH